MNKPEQPFRSGVTDDPPPFLGTWGRLYTVILVYLAALIILFALFGRAFTP